MAITSKPVLDVALMGAVLPVIVAIGRKGLTAACAGEGVDCCFSPVHSLWVMVPPGLATFVTTEGNMLVLWKLLNWLATISAERGILIVFHRCRFSIYRELFPSAVGADLGL